MHPPVENTGFRPPSRRPLGRERRTVLFAELVATIALALCTIVAATVLSVGIARANAIDGILGVNGGAGIAVVFGLIMAALLIMPALKAPKR